MAEGREGFRIGLKTGALLLFLLLLGLLAAALIGLQVREGKRAALVAAQRLAGETGARIEGQLDGLVVPLFELIDLTAHLPEVTADTARGAAAARTYMLAALQERPQVQALAVADKDGGYREWLRFDGVGGALRQSLGAPVGTVYGIRKVTRNAAGAVEAWEFLDAGQKSLGSSTPRPTEIDPRLLPWYAAASAAGRSVATALRLDPETGALGTTLARPVVGVEGEVVAAEVSLQDAAGFLDAPALGEGARLALLTGKDAVAASNAGPLQGSGTALPEAAAGDPVTAALVQAFAAEGPEGEARRFEVGQEAYLGWQRPLPALAAIDELRLAMARPLKTVEAPVRALRDRSLAVALLLGLAALAVLWFAARAVARPLGRLAEETGRIRGLDLDEPPPVRSGVREVQTLADRVTGARTALRTFARYVPQTLVHKLEEAGAEAAPEGRHREVSVLVAGIAEAEQLADEIEAESAMPLLTAQLEALGDCLLRHGAILDPAANAAVSGLWNAPLPLEDHTERACSAALECRRVLAALSDEQRAEAGFELTTRFGLHRGEALVGDIGPAERRSYTALGRTVTVAGRLERLGAGYGTAILVSGAVVEAAPGFVYRPVDLVRLGAGQEPVALYELVAAAPGEAEDGADQATLEWCTMWDAALSKYLERDFAGAERRIQALAARRADDRLAQLWLRRLSRLQQQTLGADWDGVYDAYEK